MSERWKNSPCAALIAPFFLAVALGGCQEEPAAPLAVVLVVDQLTPDLLERYDSAFEGGFRRLLDEGVYFPNAVHDHAVTFTSPGHASLATGTHPARHGVVSNSWRERAGGEWGGVSSVGDPDTRTVGGSGGGSSPHRLVVDGLPDWLLEQHSGSNVVSVSGKSTAAVLMAARARGHVYWYSTGAGGFVTSDYYRSELPQWVRTVNARSAELLPADECWRAQLPPEVAALSRPDTVPYEFDGIHTFLPHCVGDDPYDTMPQLVAQSPFLDVLTLELAREAVRSLDLGGRGVPDYLSVALSSADRVGHRYGPYSREQLENLVQLDRELDGFLSFLDETLGEDGYIVVLSSDHGVLPMPEYLQEQGLPGRRVTGSGAALREVAADALGIEPDFSEGELLERLGPDEREGLARAMEELDWVEEAYTLEELADDSPGPEGEFLALYRRSYHPGRLSARLSMYGVELRFSEGVLTGSSQTTHGAPYLHDRAVPILFAGAGIARGIREEEARTVDVAPTLARLIGVQVPSGIDGIELDAVVD